jgi:threonine/homoserine/homoserine lactone efflux protein
VIAAVAQAAALGLSAAASPGPFQALLLERAARRGPRRALALALVPLVSDPFVILACLFALAGLPPALVRALRLLGGALLLWMGWGGLRQALRAREAGDGAPGAGAEPPVGQLGFWRAALVNLLNPNAWLFWSLVGGPLLQAALRQGGGGAAAFLLAFYLPLTATNAALVLLFGAVGRLGPGVARGLSLVSAGAFLALGLAQLAALLAW